MPRIIIISSSSFGKGGFRRTFPDDPIIGHHHHNNSSSSHWSTNSAAVGFSTSSGWKHSDQFRIPGFPSIAQQQQHLSNRYQDACTMCTAMMMVHRDSHRSIINQRDMIWSCRPAFSNRTRQPQSRNCQTDATGLYRGIAHLLFTALRCIWAE